MHFHNAGCIKVEKILTLKSVSPVWANDDLKVTLSAMFPNSKIGRNFSLARTKAMYAINPYFKSLLLSNINTSEIHVNCFHSLKFYPKLYQVQKRKGDNYHSLINIGSSSLHVIQGSMGTGVDDLQWGLKKLMKEAYQLLHETPAHQDDYESITGSSAYSFSFCPSWYDKALGLEVTHDWI